MQLNPHRTLERLEWESAQEENAWWHEHVVAGLQGRNFAEQRDIDAVFKRMQDAHETVRGLGVYVCAQQGRTFAKQRDIDAVFKRMQDAHETVRCGWDRSLGLHGAHAEVTQGRMGRMQLCAAAQRFYACMRQLHTPHAAMQHPCTLEK